jgi:hypothetical protein
LHCNVQSSVAFSCIEDRADVGVIERSGESGFTKKSNLGLRVPGGSQRQQLERDRSIKPCVAGAVNFTHPPSADERQHLIVVN